MNALRHFAHFSLVCALPLAACSSSAGDETGEHASEVSATNSNATLDLVNDPDTTLAVLDGTIKLDLRAAEEITKTRNGADGIYPSADDAPFATLAALDAVPRVGPSTLTKLQAYAAAHPAPKSETVEGVAFLGWQSVAVVWGVNHSSASELDAFLDARAAKALVAGAPYASVAQIGKVSYVAAKALVALRSHSAAWWTTSKNSAFVLDATTLASDAELIKESLAEDEVFTEYLTTLTGNKNDAVSIISALEKQIDVLVSPLLGKAFPDANSAEAAVDAAAPVKALTKSGGWAYLESLGITPPKAMACVASFESAVVPSLADLLFMSESDRPFDVVFFPGAGTAAPTAQSVFALVNAPAGNTASLRNPADYFTALEPEGSPSAAAVQKAFGDQLTDVVYVAIFAPPGSINQALVDVYLVGRTSCGDLVGIHAIAVET